MFVMNRQTRQYRIVGRGIRDTPTQAHNFRKGRRKDAALDTPVNWGIDSDTIYNK